MSPKEKAIDLIAAFMPFTCHSIVLAKQCALIAIEEITKTNPTIKGYSNDLITMINQSKSYFYIF